MTLNRETFFQRQFISLHLYIIFCSTSLQRLPGDAKRNPHAL